MSQVMVTCRVTRGKDAFNFQAGKTAVVMQNTSTSETNSQHIGDVYISCSAGSHVEVTYNSAFYQDKNCLIESNDKTSKPNIYLNYDCTELWDNKTRLARSFSSDKPVSLYCKRSDKLIEMTNDQQVLLMMLTVNY